MQDSPLFSMDEAGLDKIVAAWIAGQQAKRESPEFETNW